MARPNRSRDAILEAAAELAASRGISGTTMDDIAERAGVAKGSLYYNFASKDELFEALFAQARTEVVPLLETAAAAASDGRERLGAVMRALLSRLQARPALAKLLVAEVFRSDRNWGETVGEFREAIAATFGRTLAAARPDLRAASSSLLPGISLVGATLMAGLEWLAFEPERTVDEVVGDLLALVAPAGS